MRKRLIALATALAFVCLLDPNVAFASAVPVTIEIGADGAPIGTSGEGWTDADGKLTLGAGHAFTFTGHALNVSSENLLRNKGVIEDGTFVDASDVHFAVRNEAGGVIRAARSPQASETRASSQVEPSTATRTIPQNRT
ncbi:MAG: hypothetical protein ACLTMP_03580 [Eggerthella lenta]